MTRIFIHIDRLVLRGVDHTDAPALQAALQAELERLLSACGAAQPLAMQGSAAVLRPAPLRLPPGAGSDDLGHALAGGIAMIAPSHQSSGGRT